MKDKLKKDETVENDQKMIEKRDIDFIKANESIISDNDIPQENNDKEETNKRDERERISDNINEVNQSKSTNGKELITTKKKWSLEKKMERK